MRAVVHSRIMAKVQEVASAVSLAAEGGIASDESAVAELEIEADDGSVEVPVKMPDASNAAKDDSNSEARCPIRMGISDQRCKRKLHVTPDGVDERPVCLMHSKDPRKQTGPLFDAFLLEFERILEKAGEKAAYFERFVFPHVDFRGRLFHAICRFDHAIFTQGASFFDSTFTQNANFRGATFTQNTDFWNALFKQDADFSEATFNKDANFHETSFRQDANFHETSFRQDANFRGATFTQDANFHSATFIQNANFSNATFTQNADFLRATFTQDAGFQGATFTQNADFLRATFTQDADFQGTTFTQNADFLRATFTQTVRFEETKFHGTANWSSSRFLDRAVFRRTIFDPKIAGEPSAVFALTSFSKPVDVVFDDVDLSRALFHNCDVSQVSFSSSVEWAKRPNNRGLAVFEETIDLEQEYATGLKRNGQRDYRAVEQIYHQLKKNYDSRLEYRTANYFHYGEMEMMRMAVPNHGLLSWMPAWLYRRLSPVALYRFASDYGNSYGKPFLWLLGILILSAALFPIPGLMRQVTTKTETYISRWDFQKGYGKNLKAEARLIGKSVITSIDTATFQRTPEYTPVYPWGRVLAIMETLLTSSLFALFLLAIRRQFRR